MSNLTFSSVSFINYIKSSIIKLLNVILKDDINEWKSVIDNELTALEIDDAITIGFVNVDK